MANHWVPSTSITLDSLINANESYTSLTEKVRGYDYEQVKKNVHQDAVNPVVMIVLFIVISFIISACCVVLICMFVNESDNVNDIFRPDSDAQ